MHPRQFCLSVEHDWFAPFVILNLVPPQLIFLLQHNINTNTCFKPYWQAFIPLPHPFGQCPYGNDTFQKGASLYQCTMCCLYSFSFFQTVQYKQHIVQCISGLISISFLDFPGWSIHICFLMFFKNMTPPHLFQSQSTNLFLNTETCTHVKV